MEEAILSNTQRKALKGRNKMPQNFTTVQNSVQKFVTKSVETVILEKSMLTKQVSKFRYK